MFTSKDKHWRVRPIKRDGQELLRVEHDSPAGMPRHSDGVHRCGLTRTGNGWWLAADARSAEEVAQWVPLAELEAA